jgi:hypothetical protein
MSTNQGKLGTTENEAPFRTASHVSKQGETATGDSGEQNITLGLAYQNYLEERKNLAQAFKERGQHDQEAYKVAEQQFRAYEEAIEKAIKARERAEIYASEVYREDVSKAVDNASRSYEDKTKQILNDCKQKVMEAWRSSTEVSAPMKSVCEEAIEKAMKAREKAELDALDAYKDEVDRGVEKAARVYKDKMKQALSECTQRVMNAWVTSMDTAKQMTDVFTEDRNIREEARFTAKRSFIQKLQIRETTIRLKRKFISGSQRIITRLKFRHSS